MRRLTVLSVAYPLATVGPDAVGGAEQVLTALDAALVEAGHASIVVAPAGSVTRGTLVPLPPVPADIDAAATARQQRAAFAAIAATLRETAIDLVHLHGIDAHAYLPPPGVSCLLTLHLPPDLYPSLAFARPDTWLNGVSANQTARAGSLPNLLPPIPNGVPVARLATPPLRKRFDALMLARLCPEKGVHLALQAAHAAGATLLIGGGLFGYPAHRDYVEREVRPLLDRRRRLLGPLPFARKRRLLAAARCLLVPSLAEETSSLVAMEAAACGTPVIAFRRGALPEVVEHARTGLLVDDAAEMAAAIATVGTIDPETCRRVAVDRFSLGAMTAAYLARYRTLARAAAA